MRIRQVGVDELDRAGRRVRRQRVVRCQEFADRGRLGAGLRDALLWVLLFGATITAFAYRDMFAPIRDRVLSELLPGRVETPSPGAAVV